MRTLPNIVITGTPGVGKTTHCELVASESGLRHVSVNEIVKADGCHEGWDEEYQSWIVDEDKLLDAMEDDVRVGGCLIDWHACDMFPTRWIDLVVVLRADTTTLYDRLAQRKYPAIKLEANLDSEIMDVVLGEAREAFDDEIVVELQSSSVEEMDANVARILAWIESWKRDHAGGEDGGEDSGDAENDDDDEEDDDEDDDDDDDSSVEDDESDGRAEPTAESGGGRTHN